MAIEAKRGCGYRKASVNWACEDCGGETTPGQRICLVCQRDRELAKESEDTKQVIHEAQRMQIVGRET